MQSYVIHLIRHGMTDANIKGQYAGSWDIPVCAQGEEKLKNLKNSFKYPHVEKIYTSPLSRCIQTCGIIYSGFEPIIVDGLRECNFGDWEGKTPFELSEDPTHSEWMKKGNSVIPPNGESWNDMFERVSQSFEDIVKTMMTEKIFSSAIFTHGGVIMSILYRYGLPKAEFLDWMVENGCGYSVRITPGLWMRDKVFEVYDRLPIGADVELSGGLKNVIDHMKKSREN